MLKKTKLLRQLLCQRSFVRLANFFQVVHNLSPVALCIFFSGGRTAPADKRAIHSCLEHPSFEWLRCSLSLVLSTRPMCSDLLITYTSLYRCTEIRRTECFYRIVACLTVACRTCQVTIKRTRAAGSVL